MYCNPTTKFSENRAVNGQNAVNIVKYLGCGIIIATKDGEKVVVLVSDDADSRKRLLEIFLEDHSY